MAKKLLIFLALGFLLLVAACWWLRACSSTIADTPRPESVHDQTGKNAIRHAQDKNAALSAARIMIRTALRTVPRLIGAIGSPRSGF